MARYYGVSVDKNSTEVHRKVQVRWQANEVGLYNNRQTENVCLICACNAARGNKIEMQKKPGT